VDYKPRPEFSFGVVVSGPEEMRKVVRMFLKYGVDQIKLNLSGDNFIWDAEESVRNLYYDQKIPDQLLSAPVTDEQADIALGNRFTTAKLGWQPRWYNPSLERWLHRITVPTQVIWGENDKLFPKEYAARWGAGIPNCKVEIIPQCGHVPAVEKPEVTAKIVLDLIGRS